MQRNAQHWAVALDIEAVLQAQRAELVIGQIPGQITPGLVGELRDAGLDNGVVVVVIFVHGVSSSENEFAADQQQD
jgi:diphthamide synthase subunit DPH2